MEQRSRSPLLVAVALVTAMASVLAVTLALPKATAFQSLYFRLVFSMLLAMMCGLVVFKYLRFAHVPSIIRMFAPAGVTMAVFVFGYLINPINLLERGARAGRSDALQYIEAANQSLVHQDYSSAERLFMRALDSSQESGDLGGVARSHLGLSVVAWSREDYAKAKTLGEAALSEFTTINSVSGMADALLQLGLVFEKQGDRERARRALSNALADYRQLGAIGKAELTEQHLKRVLQESGQDAATRPRTKAGDADTR